MQSGNQIYFAWCDIGEPFDPAVHNRIDSRAVSLRIDHKELQTRHASVEIPYGEITGEACHISANIYGVIKHLFYGVLISASGGSALSYQTLEFDSKDPDHINLQAEALAPAFANSILYIPQVEEAQDAIDAEVALKASTLQMEWDKDGKPYLGSIFGDPDKLKIIDGSRVVMSSYQPTFDKIPPRGAFCRIVLSATDRWVGEVDCDGVIQAEIDRISAHYGYGGGSGNFTFTPDIIKQWPKPGTTVGGSYVVIESSFSATDGPGTVPPTDSTRSPVMVSEPNGSVSGIPSDSADISATKTNVSTYPTGFSSPHIRLFGVRSKKRTEEITIFVPFAGQEVIPGNGEPIFIELQASDLDVDNTVSEWEAKEYGAGERASTSGYVFQALVNHHGEDGLLNDAYVWDPFSPTNGEKLWSPVLVNNSALGSSNVSQLANSAFGRRVIQHAIRRCIAAVGIESRISSAPFTVPLEDVWDVDTSTTVRLITPIEKGGYREGKVSSFELVADLRQSFLQASLVIVSCPGNGNPDDDFEDPENPDEPVPGEEYSVATFGGPWDMVRYQAPIYATNPLGSPESEISVKINWLGCEQEWALNNPGGLVWDPYGRIPGPDGGIPARNHFFIDNAVDDEGKPIGSDKWLEDHSTEISIIIPDGVDDNAKPVYLSVPITFGWRGPKQVIL